MVMPVTVGALQRAVEEQLSKAGCDSPAFSCICLLEDIGGIGRGQVPVRQNEVLPEEAVAAVRQAAAERATGRPLQYILGSWDFLSLTLSVGEGVLIPRPETEQLCESVAAYLAGRKTPATVYDLCAGSGCVGLGIATLCPVERVTEMEWSDEALYFLRRNAAAYPELPVTIEKRDILTNFSELTRVDVIVSNPPYIPTGDLPALQREVRHEPRMALDGAADGLLFYRVIAEKWSRYLISGGILAVEIGIGEAEAVRKLFEENGLTRVAVQNDFSAIPRVVIGFAP